MFATKVQVPTAQQPRVVRVQASQQQQAVTAVPKDVPALQRRQALGLFAATVAGVTLMAEAANAIEIPSQRSTGGLGKSGTGSIPASSSTASMEGYTMEGTRKQGISRKRKDAILAKTRAGAVAASAPSTPKAGGDKKAATKGKAS